MRNFKLFCIFMFIMFSFSGSSIAVDFGMYVHAGSGSGETEYDFDDYGDEEYDNDINAGSIGFQMETNSLGKSDRVFSYRLQAGFESRNLDLEYAGVDLNADLKLYGISVNNTFAFGGNVSDKVRLWAGPQILVGLFTAQADGSDFGYYEDDYDMDIGILVGVGVAGGANFALGDNAVLTTTIGLRATGIAGFNDYWDWDDDEEEDEYDIVTGNGGEFFMSVGIMF